MTVKCARGPRFVSSSFQRERLEYSEYADSAYSFLRRKFGGSDSVLTSTGFSNWKHATDKVKGFYRHANSKEHLAKEHSCSTRKGDFNPS